MLQINQPGVASLRPISGAECKASTLQDNPGEVRCRASVRITVGIDSNRWLKDVI